MEKKQLKTKQKPSQLSLRKETLRRLEDSELRGAAGAARVHIPTGFDDDTNPIFGEMEAP